MGCPVRQDHVTLALAGLAIGLAAVVADHGLGVSLRQPFGLLAASEPFLRRRPAKRIGRYRKASLSVNVCLLRAISEMAQIGATTSPIRCPRRASSSRKDVLLGLAVKMARKETYPIGQADPFVDAGQGASGEKHSWSNPEEGRRLIEAFLKVRQPALREEIIDIVVQLSTASLQRAEFISEQL